MPTLEDAISGVNRQLGKLEAEADALSECGHEVEAGLVLGEMRAVAHALALLEGLRWRPIAECPEEWKDGRPVVLAQGDWNGEAYWHPSGNWFLANEGPQDYHAMPFYGATHVCPLPPPPEGA